MLGCQQGFLCSEKQDTYTNAFVPPLLTETVESTEFAALRPNELDVCAFEVNPGCAIDSGYVGGLVDLYLDFLDVVG